MLLSPIPVATQYIEFLRKDLAEADVFRFAIAYISGGGLAVLGRDRLIQVLSKQDSFGVSSMTCLFGFEPLFHLQRKLDSLGNPGRLKYFMDPRRGLNADREGARLLHSKLVYLRNKHTNKSVVYIGSHNWTENALGSSSDPKNIEATFRVEEDFSRDHLQGIGSSVSGEANQHLLKCFEFDQCFSASQENLQRFSQWQEVACGKAETNNEPLRSMAVVLTVCSNEQSLKSSKLDEWDLRGQSLYLQAFEEWDGDPVWSEPDKIVVMAWRSLSDLQSARQPMLLLCRVTTGKAGQNSKRMGSNTSIEPIQGFKVYAWDPVQRERAKVDPSLGNLGKPLTTTLINGLQVSYFDLRFESAGGESKKVDDGTTPRYQFHLEIDDVALPGHMLHQATGRKFRLAWTPETLAFSEKDRVPRLRSPGYRVNRETEEAILRSFRETFGLRIETGQSKYVLPYSTSVDPRAGLRISRHALHSTYTSAVPESEQSSFYESRKPGDLAPDTGMSTDAEQLYQPTLSRVLRLYGMPLERLKEDWKHILQELDGK